MSHQSAAGDDPIVITGRGTAAGVDIDPQELRRVDRFALLAMIAADRAVESAGLNLADIDPFRCGVVVSSAYGGIETLAEQHRILAERGPDRVSAFLIPKLIINSAAGNIAVRLGFKGPGLGLCEGNQSSAAAIAEGRRWIEAGLVDLVLAGMAEAVPPGGAFQPKSDAEIVVLERASQARRRMMADVQLPALCQ